MQYLKQSTAVAIMFGPFVDKTDGITLKTDSTTITDIDHATTGIFLSKSGEPAAVRHASVTASVADAYGMMHVHLDTTDTGTVGMLDVLFAKAATYLPVHKCFMVVPANVYDSLMGTDLLDVNQAQVLGTAVHASSEAGTQCVEVVRWGGNDIAATAINGTPKVDIAGYRGTAAHTETTAGLIPAELHQVLGQSVTCAGGVTVLANVGFAGAPGAASGALTTDGTSMNQLLKQGTHTSVVIPTVTAVTNDTGITQAAADKAWNTTTRVLTAGTNIALAKGTGLTGLNDIAATAVVSGGAITTSSGAVSTVTTVGTLTTYTGNTLQTGNVATLITTVGSAGAGLTAVGDTAGTTTLLTRVTGTVATAATLADAVWDEAISGHLTSGTVGATLNGAGSAGDPWSTALPGSYGAGTAGKIIGDNINATISSRLAPAGTLATVTTLTNLPAVPTDWLAAAGVKADAVTKIQAGLATPTNITAGTIATVTTLTNLPSIPANWLTAAGVAAAALNGKGDWSTTTPPAVGAIADAVWDEATAGHAGAGSTGLALTSSSAPSAATVADAVWDEAISGHLTGGTTGSSLNGAGSAGDPWTTTLPGAYGAGTAGRLIGRSLPDVVAGGNGGLPTTNGTKLNQTADLTAGQSIACSDKTGFSLAATGADLILKSSTFVQAIVAAVNEFTTYGLTALNTLLVTTGIKAASIPKSPVTLAAADVSGNLPVDVKKINGTTVTGDGHTGTEWGS